jgi:tRNA pseudouridine38-40 synthase
MPRYKLTLEYDGTPYCGWQKQDGQNSVQGALEAALQQFVQAPVEAVCAGRTDAGVHARGQVAHVDLPVERAPFNICEGLNVILLPHPISVLAAEESTPEFHARFDAKKRHYLYRIINRSSRLALDATRAWHIFRPLDLDAMREAAAYLIGKHDFTSFRSSACQSKDPVKTLDEIRIVQREKNPEQVMIYVSARSFMHNQVRNMVGTLSLVGTGKWTPAQVKEALEAKDRSASGPTAPAHGLYLTRVEY